MKKVLIQVALAICLPSLVFAGEGQVPKGVKRLDHVFVIMMENHGYGQILNNPSAPYTNQLAKSANLATNYFAIAHPSLTNYLETVGGSNFGVLSDNASNWHGSCTPNLSAGTVNTDNPPSGTVCPISGWGTEAATPAFDSTNETQGPPPEVNIDGVHSIPAATDIEGKTIADQLVAANRTWKSYQEDLPFSGADRVNYSDGFFSNLTPGVTQSDVVQLYAAKHNPFVYFEAVQEGNDPQLSLKQTVGFDGDNGLYADLRSGHVPNYSFIAPNQCNDQHGRGNAGPFCAFDPTDNGTQAGLNPALIQRGDMTIQKLVAAIKGSRVWREGNNAIVILWDENDYSLSPNNNQVMVIVDTNYGTHSKQSSKFYTHYSLLKSIESGFGLPCLNHACDSNVSVMTDLFGAE
jgi:phosphatidylinositol-3-phosphatase